MWRTGKNYLRTHTTKRIGTRPEQKHTLIDMTAAKGPTWAPTCASKDHHHTHSWSGKHAEDHFCTKAHGQGAIRKTAPTKAQLLLSPKAGEVS
jgi:hypothetical protein